MKKLVSITFAACFVFVAAPFLAAIYALIAAVIIFIPTYKEVWRSFLIEVRGQKAKANQPNNVWDRHIAHLEKKNKQN